MKTIHNAVSVRTTGKNRKGRKSNSRRNVLSASIAAFMLSLTSPLLAVTENFTFNPGAAIPESFPLGFTDTRTLATSINVIQSMTVNITLTDNTAGFNGDIYAYLQHITPGGNAITILLNRVGKTTLAPFGFGDAGMNVTLNDTVAAPDIHVSGTGVSIV